ncbi:helix-turn-helix domain-containing protein [Elizabethkingia anophelis]|uniref:helix-turn-helix domain-containing protein n=1 Tax=Elizabethkingia anophelis TaxID=1117645 RepID=UPI0032081CF5
MRTIQFIGVNPADLIAELESSLIPKLTEKLSTQFQPKEPTEYLTRSEVCELLKINLTTLWRWQKEGMFSSYGIGNRVYFKRSEIETLLENNKLVSMASF